MFEKIDAAFTKRVGEAIKPNPKRIVDAVRKQLDEMCKLGLVTDPRNVQAVVNADGRTIDISFDWDATQLLKPHQAKKETTHMLHFKPAPTPGIVCVHNAQKHLTLWEHENGIKFGFAETIEDLFRVGKNAMLAGLGYYSLDVGCRIKVLANFTEPQIGDKIATATIEIFKEGNFITGLGFETYSEKSKIVGAESQAQVFITEKQRAKMHKQIDERFPREPVIKVKVKAVRTKAAKKTKGRDK